MIRYKDENIFCILNYLLMYLPWEHKIKPLTNMTDPLLIQASKY